MRGLFLLFVSILHILNFICITSSRPFVSNDGQVSHIAKIFASPSSICELFSCVSSDRSSVSSRKTLSLDKVSPPPSGGVGERDEYKEVSRIGSSPPSCEHKCFGCMPCEAIQVPTTSSRVGVEYANYEPEDWKCKCGTTFYTP